MERQSNQQADRPERLGKAKKTLVALTALRAWQRMGRGIANEARYHSGLTKMVAKEAFRAFRSESTHPESKNIDTEGIRKIQMSLVVMVVLAIFCAWNLAVTPLLFVQIVNGILVLAFSIVAMMCVLIIRNLRNGRARQDSSSMGENPK